MNLLCSSSEAVRGFIWRVFSNRSVRRIEDARCERHGRLGTFLWQDARNIIECDFDKECFSSDSEDVSLGSPVTAVAYQKSFIGEVFYWILVILSGGIFFLIFWWLPIIKFRLRNSKCSIIQAEEFAIFTTKKEWHVVSAHHMRMSTHAFGYDATEFVCEFHGLPATVKSCNGDEDDEIGLFTGETSDRVMIAGEVDDNEEASGLFHEGYHFIKLEFAYRIFVFNSRLWIFQELKFDLKMKRERLKLSYLQEGISSPSVVAQRRRLFGETSMKISVPSHWHLLVNAVLSPFYIFQLLAITFWLADAYYQYAISIVLILAYSCLIEMIEIRKHMKKLVKMVEIANKVNLRRFGRRIEGVPAHKIVPGDVFEVPSKMMMPCDAVLINGSVATDESLLTGEVTLVIKEALSFSCLHTHTSESNHERPEDPSRQESARISIAGLTSRSNTLYCGSKVMLSYESSTRDLPCLAIAMKTSFSTLKGSMMRSILHPNSRRGDYIYRDVSVFLVFLVIIACVCAIWSFVVSYSVYGFKLENSILRGLDILTDGIPPALPASMAVGLAVALKRFKARYGLLCVSPHQINASGSVELFVFDKTGTLTEGTITLKHLLPVINFDENANEEVYCVSSREGGIVSRKTGKFRVMEKALFGGADSSSANIDRFLLSMGSISNGDIQQLPRRFIECVATCHEVVIDENGKVLGDDAELAVFQRSNWEITEIPSSRENQTFPAMHEEDENQLATCFRECSTSRMLFVKKRFKFSSELRRMSVIVFNPSDKSYWIYCKGSPEILKELCVASSIPSDFEAILSEETNQGMRVLAYSGRFLCFQDDKDASLLCSDRFLAENSMIFFGFIVFCNNLKADSKAVIDELKAANCFCIMSTGDATGTATAVAKKCGILDDSANNEFVLFADAQPEDSGGFCVEKRKKSKKILWKLQDFSLFEGVASSSDEMKESAEQQEPQCTYTGAPPEAEVCESCDDLLSLLNGRDISKCRFVFTGQAFELLPWYEGIDFSLNSEIKVEEAEEAAFARVRKKFFFFNICTDWIAKRKRGISYEEHPYSLLVLDEASEGTPPHLPQSRSSLFLKENPRSSSTIAPTKRSSKSFFSSFNLKSDSLADDTYSKIPRVVSTAYEHSPSNDFEFMQSGASKCVNDDAWLVEGVKSFSCYNASNNGLHRAGFGAHTMESLAIYDGCVDEAQVGTRAEGHLEKRMGTQDSLGGSTQLDAHTSLNTYARQATRTSLENNTLPDTHTNLRRNILQGTHTKSRPDTHHNTGIDSHTSIGSNTCPETYTNMSENKCSETYRNSSIAKLTSMSTNTRPDTLANMSTNTHTAIVPKTDPSTDRNVSIETRSDASTEALFHFAAHSYPGNSAMEGSLVCEKASTSSTQLPYKLIREYDELEELKTSRSFWNLRSSSVVLEDQTKGSKSRGVFPKKSSEMIECGMLTGKFQRGENFDSFRVSKEIKKWDFEEKEARNREFFFRKVFKEQKFHEFEDKSQVLSLFEGDRSDVVEKSSENIVFVEHQQKNRREMKENPSKSSLYQTEGGSHKEDLSAMITLFECEKEDSSLDAVAFPNEEDDDKLSDDIHLVSLYQRMESSKELEGKKEFDYSKPIRRGSFAEFILRHAVVYSRMSPMGKANLVKALQCLKQQPVVGMCGDGANDSYALKVADVSLSLSKEHASLAANFSSSKQSISACLDILREGKAVLVNSINIFKFIVLSSIAEMSSVLLLYSIGKNFSDAQYLWIDLLTVLPLSTFTSWTATSTTLAVSRPNSKVLSTPILCSLLGQATIIIFYQAISFLLMRKPLYFGSEMWLSSSTTRSMAGETDNTHEDVISLENTVIFLITSFQCLSICLISSQNKPWRRGFHTNPFLVVWSLICSVFLCVFPFLHTHQPSLIGSDGNPKPSTPSFSRNPPLWIVNTLHRWLGLVNLPPAFSFVVVAVQLISSLNLFLVEAAVRLLFQEKFWKLC